jgi:hypothetical protein
MGELSKRSTVYFEPEIHHALRVKAANTHQSVSEVVNEAVRLSLREVALLLTRTSGAPRLFAHGFAMVAQTPLHTSRRLPWRYPRS